MTEPPVIRILTLEMEQHGAETTDRPRTRESILLHLKREGTMTAQALADRLNVTAVAVRKHLDSLEREGLLLVQAQKQPRGRPILTYQLSAAADVLFPQGYRQLSLDLIDELVETEGVETLERLLRNRHNRIKRDRLDVIQQADQDTRLRELVRQRNEDGYMATIEDQETAYLIREHNCPIYEVASRFPTACHCEEEFFSDVVMQPVKRVESLIDGDASCTYKVEK